MAEDAQWQSRPEAGTRSGLKFIAVFARYLGRRPLLWLLYPITAYFFLIRRPERAASRQYLGRVLGREARTYDVFRHFYAFARMTADRFFFLTDQAHKVPVEFVGGPEAQAVVDQARGGIFLAAHLGSFEAARVVGAALGGMDLRIVLDQQIGGRFVEVMRQINLDLVNNMIDAGQDGVGLGLAIGDALKERAWIGFLADRRRTADRVETLPFLGHDAAFPAGPYLIAATFRAPIICTFCRLTESGYEVHCEVLSDGVRLARKDRAQGLRDLAARYVERLEHHVRAAPYSWFNFYDFWALPNQGTGTGSKP